MLVARTVLLAAVEANYGTDAAPVGSNGVLSQNLKISPKFASIARKVVKQSLGEFAPIPETMGNAPGGSLTFSAELRGAGSAYSTAILPHVDPLLKACGLSPTISSGTSVTYAPVSTGIPGVTIYSYLDGQLVKAIGCRGSVKMVFKAGQPASLDFTMEALSLTETDTALVPGTYEGTTPPSWVKAGTVNAMQIGSGNYAAVINSITIDVGYKVEVQPNANTPSNRQEIVLASRGVQGSMDPEAPTVATYDFLGKAWVGSQEALTIAWGNAAWNQGQVSCPRTVFGQAAWAERNARRVFTIPFKCAELNGDDELSILFN